MMFMIKQYLLVNHLYLNIKDVGVGIAAKDGSNVNGDNINISGYKMSALMTYRKKEFYTKKTLLSLDNVMINDDNNAFLRQHNTYMKIDGKIIESSRLNVKKMYDNSIMKK